MATKLATKLIAVLAVLLNLATIYILVIWAFLVIFRLFYDQADNDLYAGSVLAVAVVIVRAAFVYFRRWWTRNIE